MRHDRYESSQVSDFLVDPQKYIEAVHLTSAISIQHWQQGMVSIQSVTQRQSNELYC